MRRLTITAIGAVALLCALAITGGTAQASIDSVSGQIELLAAPPPSLKEGVFESDTMMRAFNEPQHQTLAAGLKVDITQPGLYDEQTDLTPGTIPAGTVVNSQFLHVDKTTVFSTILNETIHTDSDIIGVILTQRSLDDSDFLGTPGTMYATGEDRKFELNENQADQVIQEVNNRTLIITSDIRRTNLDELRIITKGLVAPTVSAGPGASGVEGSPIGLAGSVTDPDSPSPTISWSYTTGPGVDLGATCSFANPASPATTVTCTDDGTYTVTLTANDGSNPAVASNATVTVSNAAPAVSITAPTAGSYTLGTPVPLSASFTDAGANDTHTCGINWGDGSPVGTGTVSESNGSGTCTGSHTYSSGGDHSIQVTVTDDDGAPGSAAVLLSNAPPTVDAGGDRSGAEGSAIALTGSVTDPDSSPTIAWSYTAGGGVDAGATCSFSPASAAAASITCTDDGTYTVTLTADDGVNPAVSSTATVTVSNANPVVTLTAPAAGSYPVSTPIPASASFTDAGSNDTHTCTVDFGDGTVVPGTVTESNGSGTCTAPPHAYAGSGDETIRITVTDDDSGSGTDAVTIHVFNAPPHVDAGADNDGDEGSGIHLGGSVTDPDGPATNLTWTFAPVSGVDAGATCSFSPPNAASTSVTCTDDGTYSVTLADNDGSNPDVSDSATITVRNANPAVLITAPSPGAHSLGVPLSASANFTDAGSNDTHTCAIEWGDATPNSTGTVVESNGSGTCTGSHTYTTGGGHTIKVAVTDDDTGSGSDTVALTFNAPPSANAGTNESGVEGSAISLSGTVTDPDGPAATITWTYATGAGVDAGSTCTFGSPGAAATTITCNDDGTYTATLTATDGLHPAVSSTVTVTVSNAAPAVTITTPVAGPYTTGTPVSLSAAFTDAGKHDTHTCSIAWGDATTTTGTVVESNGSGTCTGSHTYSTTGSKTIVVTVTDDDTAAGTASVVLTASNAAPVVSAGANKSGAEGSAISLSGTVTDPDGPAATIAWTYTAGAGVDSGSTCTFASPGSAATTITCTDDGTYTAKLTANDGLHPAVSSTVTVTVTNAAPVVTITAPTAGSHMTGIAIPVAASFTDAGKHDTHTCSIAWGDGTANTTGTVSESNGGGTCTASHTYSGSSTGSRTITVKVTDDDSASGSATVALTLCTAKSLKQDAVTQATALLSGANYKDTTNLKKFISEVNDALSSGWTDGNHVQSSKGDCIFENEEDAAQVLMSMMKSSSISAANLQSLMDKIVNADKQLATIAINDAIARNGSSSKISAAQSEVAKAAGSIASKDYDDAIDHYRIAWSKAVSA